MIYNWRFRFISFSLSCCDFLFYRFVISTDWNYLFFSCGFQEKEGFVSWHFIVYVLVIILSLFIIAVLYLFMFWYVKKQQRKTGNSTSISHKALSVGFQVVALYYSVYLSIWRTCHRGILGCSDRKCSRGPEGNRHLHGNFWRNHEWYYFLCYTEEIKLNFIVRHKATWATIFLHYVRRFAFVETAPSMSYQMSCLYECGL